MSRMLLLETISSGLSLIGLYGFLAMIAGTIIGLILGILPGFGAALGLSLLIVFIWSMPPLQGILFMTALYAASVYAGSIPGILFQVPGTGSGAATTIDGYQMTLKGQAGQALSCDIFSSFMGGIIGWAILVSSAPVIANFAMKFGPAELFSLMLFGLTIVASLGRHALSRGLLAGALGVALGTIGMDPVMGFRRYSLGIIYLADRPHLIWVIVSLFAVPQIFSLAIFGRETISGKVKVGFGLKEIKEAWRIVTRRILGLVIPSGILGAIIGAVPGAGADVASWMAYNEVKRRNPQKVGTGIPEGVIAPEAANNASVGGALIPTFTLGIPGSPASAIMLAVLLIYGIEPASAGGGLLGGQPDFLSAALIGILIANVLFVPFGFVAGRTLMKGITSPIRIIIPIIGIMAVLASYGIRTSMFGIYFVFALGFLAFVLVRLGLPMPPMLLGFILGPLAEKNLMRALIISRGSLLIFFTTPISVICLALAALSIIITLRYK